MKTSTKFIRFLRKKKCLTAFKVALKKGNSLPVNRSIDTFLVKSKPISYVSSAFTWRITQEGHSFWEILSAQWRETICLR